MWLSDGLLTTIAGFLDFQGLTRLSLASTESKQALLQEHTRQSLPYVIEYVKRQIMEERRRTPHGPFSMVVRDEHLLRFSVMDNEETGILTLFSTGITGNSLEVRTAYARSDEGIVQAMAYIQATITPSVERPIHEGTVLITRNHDSSNGTAVGYSGRLDPRLALEWCPLFMPEGMAE